MDSSKIRVSCVSYLNSIPFLYGLENHKVKDKITVELDHPSDCASKLMNKDVDLGLIPVAALSMIENYEIISDYCIGANGAVDSVLLLSNVPLQDIEVIVLDYQSITSVKLIKILCDKYWSIQPVFKSSLPGFQKLVSGNNAALVIGDRAMDVKNNFKYVYDLAASWHLFTGLPFVFACWVSNSKLGNDFKQEFNDALKFGVHNIDIVINNAVESGKYAFNVKRYLTERLNFNLTNDLLKGMNHFLDLAKEYDNTFIDR